MKKKKLFGLVFMLLGIGVFMFIGAEYYTKKVELQTPYQESKTLSKIAQEAPEGTKTALFAGGCFWCTESDYEKIDGVIDVISGYAGGDAENPNPVYQNHKGHREVIQVVYDPNKVSYEYLVDYLWRHIDPTDAEGSFYDRGHSYTSAVYYANEAEKAIAEKSKKAVEALGVFETPIVTAIEPLPKFHPAEEYHQDYYLKNPVRYKYYRTGSGRDAFIKKHWGE